MTAITILGSLWEIWETLKGLFTINHTLTMFNKTNCPTNTFNINIDKLIVVPDKEIIEKLLYGVISQQSVLAPEPEPPTDESPNS